MEEGAFIDLLRRTAKGTSARKLNDDAAVYGDLVLTHDMMVAGTHYLADAEPADVAWKLLARNLSDLAGKGATPLGVLLGYMLGDGDWDRAFARALGDALSHYDTELWGGDTVAGGGDMRAVGMTAIGRASHQPVPSRAGAQAGDTVWMTGTLGLAYAGFRHDQAGQDASAAAIARFRRPTPRLTEGVALAPQVTAIMDISDGLLLDATRLAQASDIVLNLDHKAIPVADELSGPDRETALCWGDDYELLFTLPAGIIPTVQATCIGLTQPAGAAPLLIDGIAPDPARSLGWEHGH